MIDKKVDVALLPLKYKTVIMGISIIWIMAFHSGVPCPDSMILKVLWYLFFAFGGGLGVNLFIVLSGMGLMFSRMRKNGRNGEIYTESTLQFYKRRFFRVVPTYLLIATVYYAFFIRGTFGTILSNIFMLNFVFRGERDFWYIFFIIICYIFFPLLAQQIVKRRGEVFAVVLILVTIFLSFVLKDIFPIAYSKYEIAILRFPCFVLGIVLGKLMYLGNWKEITIFNLFLLLVGLTLMAFFGITRAPEGIERIEFFLLSPTLLYIFSFILIFVEKYFGRIGQLLLKLFELAGHYSLELYVTHVSFGLLIKNAVAGYCGDVCKYIVYVFSSVVIAIVVKALVERIVSQKQIKTS